MGFKMGFRAGMHHVRWLAHMLAHSADTVVLLQAVRRIQVPSWGSTLALCQDLARMST